MTHARFDTLLARYYLLSVVLFITGVLGGLAVKFVLGHSWPYLSVGLIIAALAVAVVAKFHFRRALRTDLAAGAESPPELPTSAEEASASASAFVIVARSREEAERCHGLIMHWPSSFAWIFTNDEARRRCTKLLLDAGVRVVPHGLHVDGSPRYRSFWKRVRGSPK